MSGATGHEADTIAELAQKIGLSPEVLVHTVEEYNAACREDVPFDPGNMDGKCTVGITPKRSNWAVKIEKPPFRAYPIVCGITFTFGGVKINTKAQVLSTRRQSDPRASMRRATWSACSSTTIRAIPARPATSCSAAWRDARRPAATGDAMTRTRQPRSAFGRARIGAMVALAMTLQVTAGAAAVGERHVPRQDPAHLASDPAGRRPFALCAAVRAIFRQAHSGQSDHPAGVHAGRRRLDRGQQCLRGGGARWPDHRVAARIRDHRAGGRRRVGQIRRHQVQLDRPHHRRDPHLLRIEQGQGANARGLPQPRGRDRRLRPRLADLSEPGLHEQGVRHEVQDRHRLPIRRHHEHGGRAGRDRGRVHHLERPQQLPSRLAARRQDPGRPPDRPGASFPTSPMCRSCWIWPRTRRIASWSRSRRRIRRWASRSRRRPAFRLRSWRRCARRSTRPCRTRASSRRCRSRKSSSIP